MSPPVSVFTLTTHGLETVSAHEMEALQGVTIRQTAYRRIVATCTAPLTALLDLRTVDDVFLDVATWTGVGRTRDALARLRAYSTRLDLHYAVTACSHVRPLSTLPTFSVSASFVGRRNYSTPEIKEALAAGITGSYGWTYRADDGHTDLHVRLFVDHETAAVGVRLAGRPLHQRSYRQVHRPGALKPSVAAALVALAGVAPGLRVFDPCCGTGVVVIEAAYRGAVAQGGDLAPEAIDAARVNAARAGLAARFDVMDVRRLPLRDWSMDRVISNLPWGRQVCVAQDLAAFYRLSLAEMARILAPGGRIAVLTGVPHLIRLPGLCLRDHLDISLCGQRPTIQVWAASS